jgi:hypothetical protein
VIVICTGSDKCTGTGTGISIGIGTVTSNIIDFGTGIVIHTDTSIGTGIGTGIGTVICIGISLL